MSTSNLINITISVPNGTVTHDDGHVLCVYGNYWRTTLHIATFFAANYAAHAATIKSNPGDRTSVTICNMALALFFPVSGLMRAVNAIVRFGRWGTSDLEKACRSGALCMVVRVNGWLPSDGQTLDVSVIEKTRTGSHRTQQDTSEEGDRSADHVQTNVDANVKVYRPNYAVEGSSTWFYSDASGGRANVDTAATKIHGTFSLPSGYGFAILPRNTRLLEWLNMVDGSLVATTGGSEIAYTYSMAKAVISIVQSLAALIILLGHQDDIVHRWGYASFHLTILPYLVMTFFNFASNICTADYDGLYMVETPVMDEARSRGGQFEATVAATYTATTFGSENLHQLSTSELRSYHGLESNFFRGFAQKLAEGKPIVLIRLLNRLSIRQWSHQSATCAPVRVTAVALGNDIRDAQTPAIECREPTTEQQEIDANTRISQDQGTSAYVPDLPPSSQAEPRFATAIHLITDDGLCYIPRVPTKTPSLATTMKNYVFFNVTDRASSHVRNLKESFFHFCELGGQILDVNHADQGAFLYAKFISELMIQLGVACIGLSASLRVWTSTTSPDTSGHESSIKAKEVTLYIPMCQRFLRSDDMPKEIDEHKFLVPAQTEDKDLGHAKCGRLSIHLPVRRWHNVTGGILAQLTIGMVVLGVLVVLIGWQSRWFSAGSASLTQRVIMILWMCEGMFGIFMTLLTPREIMLVFFLFPLYTLLHKQPFLSSSPIALPFSIEFSDQIFIMSLLPLAIFIAPIWGFVIVGKMLVDWGQCVTLYP